MLTGSTSLIPVKTVYILKYGIIFRVILHQQKQFLIDRREWV